MKILRQGHKEEKQRTGRAKTFDLPKNPWDWLPAGPIREPLPGSSESPSPISRLYAYYNNCLLYSCIAFSYPKYNASLINACPIDTSSNPGIFCLKYARFCKSR